MFPLISHGQLSFTIYTVQQFFSLEVDVGRNGLYSYPFETKIDVYTHTQKYICRESVSQSQVHPHKKYYYVVVGPCDSIVISTII